MPKHYIAELNIARLKYDINDPRVSDFVNNLNRVNAVAERSEGFIWRLVEDASKGETTVIMDDPRVIPNLSVWQDVVSLEKFVFQTVHRRIYARRAEWFEAMEKMHFVMWPVPAGHLPDLPEALERLDMLNTHGPSDDAFGWDYARTTGAWRNGRCSDTAA
ncbi:DUF3291 domain-containing protein [Roseibium sp. MMSF_3412]|uniref:DUF3291 domain-containing protein n=1 Tax=Roseibium sp. MMSF_3412 TaxID=3046712 RepID=UPI00273D5FAE|nr:DUF3291 domain-containing protein [Roseibium sp. MMSF_3412]